MKKHGRDVVKAVEVARGKGETSAGARRTARRGDGPVDDVASEIDRLTRELSEANEHRAATEEVLSIISRSPRDAQRVFDAIVDSAARLCGSVFSIVELYDGERLHVAAATRNVSPEALKFARSLATEVDRSTAVGRAIVDRKIVHVQDVLEDEDYSRAFALAGGWRAVLSVPMLRDGQPVGAVAVGKADPVLFTQGQVRLLGIFADQAVIAIENARLFAEAEARNRELGDALQQQTATANVLKSISSATFDLEAVLRTLVTSAIELCRATSGDIFLREGDVFRLAMTVGTPKEFVDYWRSHPVVPGRDSVASRVALAGAVVHVEDVLADPDYKLMESQKIGGYRTVLGVPLLRHGRTIGAFILSRENKVEPFSEREIQLIQTFSDQAVIALENVRLFDEIKARNEQLNEALERQTAMSDVLRVISSSPGVLEPVFEAVLKNAVRICGAEFGILFRPTNGGFHAAAMTNVPAAYRDRLLAGSFKLGEGTATGRAVRTKTAVQIADLEAETAHEDESIRRASVKLGGARTIFSVPMMKEGDVVGAITIYRKEVKPFTDKQIELVGSFAAQAVIAMENARLLNELHQRTDELSEALEQQTATAEILAVISNSLTDTQPVFDAIVRSGMTLFPGAAISIAVPEGGKVKAVAIATADAARAEAWRSRFPIPLSREYLHSLAILERRIVDLSDAREAPPELAAGARNFLATGYRAMTVVPLLRGEEAIGALSVSRLEPGPLSNKQRAILKTFASQAVIAIENTRLLKELRDSLQQQTATAEVLKVISRSAFDVERVFEAVAESAVRLCEADKAFIFRFDGERLNAVVGLNASPQLMEFVRNNPIRPGRHSTTARAALTRKAVHIEDALADPEYTYGARDVDRVRTNLAVPMLRGAELLGVITIYRQEVKPFTANQIVLVETFADQAAIAIENARLFAEVETRNRELDEALRRQTATAEVLKTISRSTFDLPTVLKTLVEAAARLCEADQGTIAREQDGRFRRVASYGFSEAFNELIATLPVERERGTASGRALAEGRIVHIPDVQADPEYTFSEGRRLGGFRTILAVPMLREGIAIGVLALTRTEPRPFTEKQIELVSTFADQAAIAIENVRLFESAQARTRELAASLEDLRTAQDRLVQTEKLASLGQLTAGIAHEIKNPLNFVNNFSSVSVELVDELREGLSGLDFESKAREEVDELAEMLRGNLDKIVQHGKRADSIVKNMLMHARQGSGEHRPVDINTVVEESLNLAYHGARAERQGFNITLERALDPAAGVVDLFPQEITRVLLNLISNGFYATMKRKAQSDGESYEPTLKASTRSLGDRVEIAIRDNGTGIPPEVKERLFSPFFTTKPVGEGTGLGLSISHDIVVKQHSGSIEVDTCPGEFTEFRIVLPRTVTNLALGG